MLLVGREAHADLIDLGTLGGTTSQAWAIQSNGRVVVGVSDNGSAQQAFVYQVNAGFTGGTITALGFLVGGNAAEARAINASGLIVGYSRDSGAIDQAVTWTGTSPTLITNTLLGSGARALGVSTGGIVVGWANKEIPGIGVVQRAFVSVFLTPSSVAILEARLKKRGQDSPANIQKRLSVARQEIAQWKNFDYLIISTSIQEDLRRMLAVVDAEKMRQSRAKAPEF